MPEIKLAKPTKYAHPKGTPITVVDQYTSKSTGEKVFFIAPKIDGVYYGKSVKFFESAINLRENVFHSKGPVNPKDLDQGNAFIDKTAVFEFFTEACSGTILLFAAVESLVNDLIESAHEYNYSKIKKDKILSIGKYFIGYKKSRILSLEQLLFLNIEEKIKNVLPCLYKFEFLSNNNFWQDFKNLKSLRDGFIHCTHNHAYGASRGVNSLYSQLFDVDFEKLVNSIGNLLTYLKNNAQKI
jgi:hypothetical protein